jgi:hypothetical protein
MQARKYEIYKEFLETLFEKIGEIIVMHERSRYNFELRKKIIKNDSTRYSLDLHQLMKNNIFSNL